MGTVHFFDSSLSLFFTVRTLEALKFPPELCMDIVLTWTDHDVGAPIVFPIGDPSDSISLYHCLYDIDEKGLYIHSSSLRPLRTYLWIFPWMVYAVNSGFIHGICRK